MTRKTRRVTVGMSVTAIIASERRERERESLKLVTNAQWKVELLIDHCCLIREGGTNLRNLISKLSTKSVPNPTQLTKILPQSSHCKHLPETDESFVVKLVNIVFITTTTLYHCTSEHYDRVLNDKTYKFSCRNVVMRLYSYHFKSILQHSG